MTRTPSTAGIAVDLGSRWTTIAVGGPDLGRPRRVPGPGASALRSLAGGPDTGFSAVGRTLTEVLRTGPQWPGHAPGPVGSLVVAVPDRWAVDPAGVLARERLRELLSREHGLSLGRCVAQAEGAAAAVAASGRADGPVLVCDLGASSATVAYCEIDGTRVELVDLETAEDGATAGAFVDVLGAAIGNAGTPQPAGATEAMLLAGLCRIVLVLERAVHQTRYRATPVLRTAGVTLTAGQVLECFRPVAARLTGMIAALVGRRAAAADVPTVVLAGGLAGFPLTVPTALAALGRARPPEVALLEPAAIAVGAAAVGDGAVQVGERATASIGMPIHQVRDGVLRGELVVLNRAGTPLPVEVERMGAPLVVEVGDRAPASLVLQVERAGSWQPAVVRPDRPVPPGRYAAGLWPALGRLGALVLRPVDGGTPLVYSISDPTGPEGAR